MKQFLIIFMSVLSGFGIYGQTQTGTLVLIPTPCETAPCLPGVVLGIETASGVYVVTVNSFWISDCSIAVDSVVYNEGDTVEIKGATAVKRDLNGNKYIELEIETIGKITTGTFPAPDAEECKIYFDAASQTVVIRKTQQSQSFTLELTDVQGKVILSKANIGGSVNISDIPDGIYLCRILQNGATFHSGKIIKR